jgi:hypothetical protein
MRAFTLRFLALLFMGAAIFTAATPAYAAVTGGTSTVHPLDVCPPSTHWDNTLNECVPN